MDPLTGAARRLVYFKGKIWYFQVNCDFNLATPHFFDLIITNLSFSIYDDVITDALKSGFIWRFEKALSGYYIICIILLFFISIFVIKLLSRFKATDGLITERVWSYEGTGFKTPVVFKLSFCIIRTDCTLFQIDFWSWPYFRKNYGPNQLGWVQILNKAGKISFGLITTFQPCFHQIS